MVYERFVKQLDGCSLCGGRITGGFNCTAASGAMWLYRASQGRISTTSCHARDLTNDCDGGLRLEQAQAVSASYGISGGALYKPTTFATVQKLLTTGRYGAIFQLDYSPIAGTRYDCFGGGFRAGHAMYASSGGTTCRAGDPGADGRRAGVPTGFQSYPWALLERAAGMLVLDDTGITMDQRYGPGHIFAYVTPADPLVSTQRYRVAINTGSVAIRFPLLDRPFGTKKTTVSRASYICTLTKQKNAAGVVYAWYRIVSKTDGSHTDNAGLYFTPTRYTKAVPA